MPSPIFNNYMAKGKLLLIIAIAIMGICLLGYIPSNTINLRLSKKLLMEWAIVIMLIFFFIKNIWMKLFLGWILARVMMTFNPQAYFYFTTTLMFIVFYQVIKNKLEIKNFNTVLNGICIITLVQVFMMLMQVFNWWFVIYPQGFTVDKVYFKCLFNLKESFSAYGKQGIVGFFGNINDTSALLVLALPAFFRRRWWWGIPLVGLALILAKSLGGIITAFFIVLYFILVFIKKYRFKFATLWVVFGIWAYRFVGGTHELLSNERYIVWKDIYQNMIKKRPIIGSGFGQFYSIFPKIQEKINSPFQHFNKAHNEYIEIWAELGTIGLLIVLGYIGHTLFKGAKAKFCTQKILFAGLLAGLLNAFVNFTFHITVAIFFMVYLAMFEKGGTDGEKILA